MLTDHEREILADMRIKREKTDGERLLLHIVGKLEAELERYRNPLPGDLEQQAAAWVAVHDELLGVGLGSFIGKMTNTGRDRACEFIRHLGEERQQ